MTRTLTIAVGSSRYSKKWKNKEIEWDDLCDDLSNFTTTKETYREYTKKPKSERDKIKDIGGFMGGGLNGPQRTLENIAFKDLLTLDLDRARADFWDDLVLFNEWACCIYSTHSHSSKTPHLRLVAPLSRRCTVEEYMALARKIMEELGASDQTDKASFVPVQLMYWPSKASDGEYVYERQDGPWIDVDEVLARYVNWRDVSQWKTTTDEDEAKAPSGKKAEDPLQKEGLIGAFCRTYSIQEAIEKFIPEVYTPGSSENRYTYAAGSSSNGFVVYQNGTLAYSNHATDPASGHALNAWDLVRIHMFGQEDRNSDSDTPVNKLPSYKSMTELVQNDADTSATLNLEQVKAAQEAFADIDVSDEDLEWVKTLERDKRGIKPTINNYYKIISNDPMIKDCCGRYNEFTDMPEYTADPAPWKPKPRAGESWQDADDSGLRMYIEDVYKINNKGNYEDALTNYHRTRSFHPVREYLDSLEWDGKERLDTLLIDYLGADDTPYTRAVTRKTVCAAVKRVYQPGCKFDQMLILTGPQGCGKSTLAAKLGREWFSDTIDTAGMNIGTDKYDQLQAVWIGEDSELSKWSQADVAASKRFVSSAVDSYRKKFNRRGAKYPRQCIFIGTTNSEKPLHDNTGNRRYWVVEVRTMSELEPNVWDDLTDEVVDQIYAEAKYRLKHGEKLYLDDKDIADAALAVQEEFLDIDPWEDSIRNYLDIPLPDDWDERSTEERINYIHGGPFGLPERGSVQRQYVCVREILRECLKIPEEKIDRRNTRRVGEIMAHRITGWTQNKKATKRFKLYGTQKYYERTGEEK